MLSLSSIRIVWSPVISICADLQSARHPTNEYSKCYVRFPIMQTVLFFFTSIPLFRDLQWRHQILICHLILFSSLFLSFCSDNPNLYSNLSLARNSHEVCIDFLGRLLSCTSAIFICVFFLIPHSVVRKFYLSMCFVSLFQGQPTWIKRTFVSIPVFASNIPVRY